MIVRVRLDRILPALLLLLPLAGCNATHVALDPRGAQADRIEGLWWLYFWLVAVVYVVTMLFVLVPAFRSHRARRNEVAGDAPTTSPDGQTESKLTTRVGIALGLTAVILFVLVIGDYSTGRAIHTAIPKENMLSIRLTARQWWWEVQYQDETPSKIVTTANEIHIPVGRTIQFDLQSTDVIHSFWIPNLHGKKDMIPGHPTLTWLRAEKAGTYWGQCAEFCGLQHAKMRLAVIAEEPAAFERWLAGQRSTARPPQTEVQKRGQVVFLESSCIMCHTIDGTSARGRVGPNLTHLAGRQTIASGWLPNRPGHLAGWIIDPQKIKPGARMPQNSLKPQDLRALLEYLESLE